MNHFSDFAKENDLGLDGSKIPISEIFNKTIVVLAYRKLDSKAVRGKTCVQIQFELDGEKHVTFTNSAVIERQLDEYSKMLPFDAAIKKRHNYYTFAPAEAGQEDEDGRVSENAEHQSGL